MLGKIHALRIKKAEITQSKASNRYGWKLELVVNDQENITFDWIIWFGNYMDYQKDNSNKSALIWLVAYTHLEQMKLPEDAYDEPEKMIGHYFLGYLKVDEYGLYLASMA